MGTAAGAKAVAMEAVRARAATIFMVDIGFDGCIIEDDKEKCDARKIKFLLAWCKQQGKAI